MSSVLGHGLAGLAVYQAVEQPARLPGGGFGVVLALGLSLLPDLDVVGVILWPGQFAHRGFSHSLLFVAAVSGVLAGLLHLDDWRGFPRAWYGLFAVCAVHPLLDYLMARGPGVPFFWPWDKTGYLAPIQFLPTAYYSHSFKGLAGLLSHGPTLKGMAIESAIFGPLLALTIWLNRWRRKEEKENSA